MKKFFLFKSTVPIFLLLGFLFFSTSLRAEELWDGLDTTQQELLKNGNQVLVAEQIPGALWPAFHVYRVLKTTPLEAAAIFWDVKEAPRYIPDCLCASLEEPSKANVLTVHYEVRVPLFPKEISQVRDEVNELPSGGYKISWDVLQSTYSKSGHGSFVVVPHGAGTLMCYSNFINPGSAIAFLLKKQAQVRVANTASAIARHIESEVGSAPERLAIEVEQLKKALKK